MTINFKKKINRRGIFLGKEELKTSGRKTLILTGHLATFRLELIGYRFKLIASDMTIKTGLNSKGEKWHRPVATPTEFSAEPPVIRNDSAQANSEP